VRETEGVWLVAGPAHGPRPVGKRIADLAREVWIVIRHDDLRPAELRHVDEGVHREVRAGENAGALLQFGTRDVEILVVARQQSRLRVAWRDCRKLAPGECGSHVAVHRAQQELGAPPTGLAHVGMRVCVVADQCGGVRRHALRDVPMQVQRRDDRNLGADHGAHPLQQLTLGVVAAVGHHRSVKRDEYTVHRHRLAHARDDAVPQLFVDLALDGTAGPGRAGTGAHQLDVVTIRADVQQASELRALRDVPKYFGARPPCQRLESPPAGRQL
jgi:hypothetical protein